MNAMTGNPEDGSGDGDEPEIILLGIERSSYYLYKGEDHINQLLIAEGTFPSPILVMEFDSIIDAKIALGSGFSIVKCWAIHPAIVERLRSNKHLIESDT